MNRGSSAGVSIVLAVSVVICAAATTVVKGRSPQSVSATDLQTALNKLGSLDYDTRTAAARTVRRTSPSQAVPALQKAVAEHEDGYVRYKALVLLTGFADPHTKETIRLALRSPNDRLRTVAYGYFEQNPDRTMVPDFIAALDTERAEFVRPALVRALAPLGDDVRVQQALVREVGRGEDFFRSVVIEALGDHKARYAYDAVTAVALVDGPLQADAALALGGIGEQRALPTLASLQRTAPRERQPSIAAAICLLGVNCDVHQRYLIDALTFADANKGYQAMLRGSAAGLAAIAVGGHAAAADTLLTLGIPSMDPTRAPLALAVGTVALRNAPLLIAVLQKRADRSSALDLVAEGFDMLEEDLDKERFFTFVRHEHEKSPDGSPARELMQTLMTKLDF